jgi:hypothetical protein
MVTNGHISERICQVERGWDACARPRTVIRLPLSTYLLRIWPPSTDLIRLFQHGALTIRRTEDELYTLPGNDAGRVHD